MNGLTVREFHLSEYDALAEVLNLAYPSRPTTAADESRQDREAPPHLRRRRWTAATSAGVAGFGEYLQNHWTPPDCYLIRLAVHPLLQGCGIGAALFREVMGALDALGAREARTLMPRQFERAVRFFEDRGFRVTGAVHRSQLDLGRFRPEDWRAHIDQAAARGYRFVALPEFLREETAAAALWRLRAETEADVPRGSEPAPESLDEFRCRILERPNLVLEASYAAVTGPAAAGVTELTRPPVPDRLHVGYTGVARAHRGLGLGLALKLLSIQFAKAEGFRYLTTSNHESNAPILRINERLGFEKVESQVTLTLDIHPEAGIGCSARSLAAVRLRGE